MKNVSSLLRKTFILVMRYVVGYRMWPAIPSTADGAPFFVYCKNAKSTFHPFIQNRWQSRRFLGRSEGWRHFYFLRIDPSRIRHVRRPEKIVPQRFQVFQFFCSFEFIFFFFLFFKIIYPHPPPRERDRASDYRNYGKAVKGCPILAQCKFISFVLRSILLFPA